MLKTFVMVKPDGVQRGLVGKIIQRFEEKGFQLLAMKMLKPEEALLEKHYAEHKDKPFLPRLLAYMSSGPVVAMCWSGKDAPQAARALIGATDPLQAAPGTIRADFGMLAGRNLVHGSDSQAAAERELALWFGTNEMMSWSAAISGWINEVDPAQNALNASAI